METALFFRGIPSDFKVTLSDQREFDAEFLGKDDQAQVAFIQIQNLPPELALKPVTFAGSAHIGVGDPGLPAGAVDCLL